MYCLLAHSFLLIKSIYRGCCKGVYIFCEGISSQFIDNVPEDDGE